MSNKVDFHTLKNVKLRHNSMVGVNFRSRLVRVRPKIPLYAKNQPCGYCSFFNEFCKYVQTNI